MVGVWAVTARANKPERSVMCIANIIGGFVRRVSGPYAAPHRRGSARRRRMPARSSPPASPTACSAVLAAGQRQVAVGEKTRAEKSRLYAALDNEYVLVIGSHRVAVE